MTDLSQPIDTKRGVTLWVEGDALMVKYSVWAYGFLGTKRVPAANVVTFDWKEPGGMTAGILQIAIMGEAPPPSYASPNVRNQNRFIFDSRVRDQMDALRTWLQARMEASRAPAASSPSTADELTKLADLLDRGLLTRDEFDQQKRSIIGTANS